MRELILTHAAGLALGLERRQAERGDRGRIEKCDRTPVRLAFPLRELQQVERALHVDLVRRARRELRTRREQRRQMEDQVDFELSEDALERRLVEDRPHHFALDLLGQRRFERRHIERDDSA